MSIYSELFETIFCTKQNIQALRNKVLDLAIQGKLVKQDPNDEPADKLMERVRSENQKLSGAGKAKKGMSLGKIEDEKPFKIPNNWEWARLGEIITIKSGNGLIKKNMNEGAIPVYGGNGITGYHSEPNIWKPTIIIGRVGFYCGSIHLTKGEAWVTDNAFVTSFSKKNFDIHFMAILLKSMKLGEQSNSTAQPVVSGKSIYPLFVPIPPLAEQKKIALKVEFLMSEIDKLEHYIERKERLEEAIPQAVVSAISNCSNEEELKIQLGLVIEYFSEIFQAPGSLQELRNVILQLGIQGKLVPQNPSDESTSELLKHIQTKKKILIKEKKIKNHKTSSEIGDDEIPFEIPASWEWVRLNDICEYIQRGKSPKYSPVEKYPVIAQKCVQWTGVSLGLAQYIEPSSIEKYSEERFLQHGDILWNSTGRGSCGRVGKFSDSIRNGFEKIVADSHVTVVRCFTQYINFDYLFMWLKSPEVQSVIESKASGSTNQIELATSTIKEQLISLPPLSEQQRIVNKIESLLVVIDKLEKEMLRKQSLVNAMAIV